MSSQPLVIEQRYRAPIARVWAALTDPQQMKKWYFDIPGFKAEAGFEFQFTASNEDRDYLHLCRVVEVVEGRLLAYTWRYDQYPGDSLVRFELFEEGEYTRLRLTHEGLASFPGDMPDFAYGSFLAGWTDILGTFLHKYLEGAEISG